jgi:hypothetical protein
MMKELPKAVLTVYLCVLDLDEREININLDSAILDFPSLAQPNRNLTDNENYSNQNRLINMSSIKNAARITR